MNDFIIIYGGDSSSDGTLCGPEGAKRIERAISFILSNNNSYIVILSAGLRPDKPAYPPLKEVMENYLIERLREEGLLSRIKVVISSLDSWRTLKESLSAKNEIDKIGDCGVIYLCSSFYHLPRIKFIWKVIGEGKETQVLPAMVGNMYSIMREIPAMVRLIRELLFMNKRALI